MYSLLWRLLRRNISATQTVIYALAVVAGVTIVLCAVQFYGDVSAALRGDTFMHRDFMILSRRVSAVSTLGLGGDNTFSDNDIRGLQAQPWVRSAGTFTAADFNVEASVHFGNAGMSTHLFLESVPDEFLDIRPAGWDWHPGDAAVPVILSKDYLALYNFGFAPTHGLPQLSEGVMGAVPLMLTLSGNGHAETVPARIVGFSSRLNTIAVPETFMQAANARYGSGQTRAPSRVIVNISDPGNPAIGRWLSTHNVEAAGNSLDTGRTSYLLTLVTTVVIAVGGVITLLAFMLLALSIALLMHRNRYAMHTLMRLGYAPWRVMLPYVTFFTAVNACAIVAAWVAARLAAGWWRPRLADLDIAAGSTLGATLTAVAALLLLTAVTAATVTRAVRRAF